MSTNTAPNSHYVVACLTAMEALVTALRSGNDPDFFDLLVEIDERMGTTLEMALAAHNAILSGTLNEHELRTKITERKHLVSDFAALDRINGSFENFRLIMNSKPKRITDDNEPIGHMLNEFKRMREKNAPARQAIFAIARDLPRPSYD